ncbi:MAG: 1-deoxy-D-xylulose-5-phosphate synthase [Clostridiales bacterium]|nr:1-deoxy-D-xylulose-5-phosphate synthase [Clostridiales bacterium]
MLEKIDSPRQLKSLSLKEKQALAGEIREKIIDTVSRNGGHLASNLGAVELTIALHSVLDAPKDKLLFDVGHQCYAHKLLTGRYERFSSLRKAGGISGFTRRDESEYDEVNSGHASDSVSLALGMARARELRGEDCNIALVLGDGALTGGMVYEALNDAGLSCAKMLIVLNDNEMSISKNVGSLAKHLTRMRQSGGYRGLKQSVKKLIYRLPKGGKSTERLFTRIKNAVKALFVSDQFFESLEIEYLGPIDGHDIGEMERVFSKALTYDVPVLVHVVTKKGKGYPPAEETPGLFHGVGPFDRLTGKPLRTRAEHSCGKAVANWLISRAETNKRICAVSAAMLDGTGLSAFNDAFPDRCFDVGIAEGHAAGMAAGMALNGMKPYLALYSTFMQRAYDQINLNICLNRAPVTLLIDRSGLNGADGETHQGVFDTSLLCGLPGLCVAVPASINELERMMELSLEADMPFAVKYPKSLPEGHSDAVFGIGEWDKTRNGHAACIISCGRMLKTANEAADKLASSGIDCAIVNARFLKPLDEALLKQVFAENRFVFTLEDSVRTGSLGEEIASRAPAGVHVRLLCVPDKYIPAGSAEEQLKMCALDAESVAGAVYETLKEGERG